MTVCYIGVGSNLGNRAENIKNAIRRLENIDGVKVNKVSHIYETEPIGGPPQPKFLNGVIEIETYLRPESLLRVLQDIERELGRVRQTKNGPRTIDLDILLYGDEEIHTPELQIPHPRMYEREFVMKPLNELRSGIVGSDT